MVRYLFYTIGDLTYQSPLVFINNKLDRMWRKRPVFLCGTSCCSKEDGIPTIYMDDLKLYYATHIIISVVSYLSKHVTLNHPIYKKSNDWPLLST